MNFQFVIKMSALLSFFMTICFFGMGFFMTDLSATTSLYSYPGLEVQAGNDLSGYNNT